MITGDDVRRTRGTMSRKKFSEMVGISEAKIAGIENGRKIRPDELDLLSDYVTEGSEPIIPILIRGTTSPVMVTGTGDSPPRPRPEPAPKPFVPYVPTSQNGTVEVLDFETDIATPIWEPEFWSIVTLLPVVAEAPHKPTIHVPEGSRLVSNSEIQTYKRCKRKWWLSFYRGLRPASTNPNGPLNIGTRAHKALAEYYVGEGLVRTDPRDALERILVEDWTNIETSTDDSLKLETYAKEFKTEADLLRAMLEGYMQWLEENGEDEDLEIVASEAPMAAQMPHSMLDGTPVYITGRMDVRVRRRIDGARLFMDHKTLADFTSPSRTLHMNPQMLHYHLLEVLDLQREQIERGDEMTMQVERTDGALYNMLRKVKRSVNAKPPFYQRIEVRHNDHEIESYAKQLRGILSSMIETQTQLDMGYDNQEIAYPTPNDTCAWSCEFFAVCPMFNDGSRAENFIENNFVEVDPYDRYPEFT